MLIAQMIMHLLVFSSDTIFNRVIKQIFTLMIVTWMKDKYWVALFFWHAA